MAQSTMIPRDNSGGQRSPEREIAEHYQALIEAVRRRVWEINEMMSPAVEEALAKPADEESNETDAYLGA